MAKRKAAQPPKAETLLVELLTEELPPKTLRSLGDAFSSEVAAGLRRCGLLGSDSEISAYATPRRLAVRISNVLAKGDDKPDEQRLMPLSVARGADGNWTEALRKKLAGMGRVTLAPPDTLVIKSDGKAESVYLSTLAKGWELETALQRTLQDAVEELPIPKLMSYQLADGSAEKFVRPVHSLLMLHGNRKLSVSNRVLGFSGGIRCTRGHRFLSKGEIEIKHADSYERVLEREGHVIASFERRRERIRAKLEKHSSGLEILCDDALLDEITALVEWPAVYKGTFDPQFLEVPEKCLVLSMQQHQRYVPLRELETRKLLPRFLFVSNVETKNPSEIIRGNERVLRARLADAKFFYDQDRMQRLDARVAMLKSVVYHNKLGTQFDRVERIRMLAGHIAHQLGANAELAERAGFLSKADLLTNMVGEFPELQGLMGGYYAKNDHEADEVCQAIADQYRLRLDDADPENLTSVSLYLADRVDSLLGLFGIGEVPTGEKDPFGLRRAALGVISAFELISAARKIANSAAPDVRDFLAHAATLFPHGRLSNKVVDQVHDFILERYSNNLATVFHMDKKAVEAVLTQRPNLMEVKARVDAVQTFQRLPEAESLATANKRIRNILRKSDATQGELNEALLTEPAEKALFDSMQKIEPQAKSSMQRSDFPGALRTLATIRGAVDKFFDDVLVNAEDARVRANRHALLRRLDALMNQVADISKLAVEK